MSICLYARITSFFKPLCTNKCIPLSACAHICHVPVFKYMQTEQSLRGQAFFDSEYATVENVYIQINTELCACSQRCQHLSVMRAAMLTCVSVIRLF